MYPGKTFRRYLSLFRQGHGYSSKGVLYARSYESLHQKALERQWKWRCGRRALLQFVLAQTIEEAQGKERVFYFLFEVFCK